MGEYPAALAFADVERKSVFSAQHIDIIPVRSGLAYRLYKPGDIVCH